MKIQSLFEQSAFRFASRLFFKRSNSPLKMFDSSLNSALTDEESDFFVKNGFLVKQNAVSNEFIKKLLSLEHSYFSISSESLQPKNVNTIKFNEVKTKLIPTSIVIDRYGKVQFPIDNDVCIKSDFFFSNTIIPSIASSLIGSQRMPSSPNINGVYYTFPCSISNFATPYIHTDTGSDVIRFIVYLSDVTQGSGGFHVWPGSHLPLRELYFTEIDSEPNMLKYWETLYKMALKTPFVEIAAPSGTCIFWHHRLAHAAGLNRSNEIRKVFIAGYSPLDTAYRDSLSLSSNPWEHWAVGNNYESYK